jgi:hypothetical protein
MLIRQLGVGAMQLHRCHVRRTPLQIALSSNRAIVVFTSFRCTRHLHLDDFSNPDRPAPDGVVLCAVARGFPNCDPVSKWSCIEAASGIRAMEAAACNGMASLHFSEPLCRQWPYSLLRVTSSREQLLVHN